MNLYTYCYKHVVQPVDRWPFNIAVKRLLRDRRNRRSTTLANVLERFTEALFRNPLYNRYSRNYLMCERSLRKHLGNYGPRYVAALKEPVMESTMRSVFAEAFEAHPDYFTKVTKSVHAMSKFLAKFHDVKQFYRYVDSLSKTNEGIQIMMDEVINAVPLTEPGVLAYWLYRAGCRFYYLPESFLLFCDNYSEGHYSCYPFSLALVNTLAKESHVSPYRMGTLISFIYDGIPGFAYTEEELAQRRHVFEYALAYFYLKKGRKHVIDSYPPLPGDRALEDAVDRVFEMLSQEQEYAEIIKAAEEKKKLKRQAYNNRKRPKKPTGNA